MARRRPAFQVPDRTSCRKVTLCSLQAPRSEGGVQAGSLCVAPEAAAEGAETRRPRDRARGAACTQDNTVTLQPAVPTSHPAATRAVERLLGPCRGVPGSSRQQLCVLRLQEGGSSTPEGHGAAGGEGCWGLRYLQVGWKEAGSEMEMEEVRAAAWSGQRGRSWRCWAGGVQGQGLQSQAGQPGPSHQWCKGLERCRAAACRNKACSAGPTSAHTARSSPGGDPWGRAREAEPRDGQGALRHGGAEAEASRRTPPA